MNMLIVWIEDGPESTRFKKHVSRVPDFMWMSKEGMMMNGTNGSQSWDTSFAVQAILAGDLYKDKRFEGLLRKNLEFLELCQV
jgi:lanosterol synthase